MTKEERLFKLREIQRTHGPNYCLASAKFFIGKLVGIFDDKKHLNDFMKSPWRLRNQRIDMIAAWGLFRGAKDFNTKVLPAAVKEQDANVMSRISYVVRRLISDGNIEFHSFQRDSASADALLNNSVPLVIGVDLADLPAARDHFVSIVKDQEGNVWVVDSWGESDRSGDRAGVAQLPKDFSFAKPAKDVMLNAGRMKIPCEPSWFGYYRMATTKEPLKTVISL